MARWRYPARSPTSCGPRGTRCVGSPVATGTATAAAVADLAVDELGFAAGEVLVARGDAFPDALAAGPLGGVRQAPVLLTPGPDRLGSAAATWIAQRCEAIDLVTAIGGPAALAEVVLDAAEREARECGYASVTPYLVLGATRTGAHGLVPVARQVAPTTSPLAAALEALLAGPTAAEASASPPVTTAIPAGTGLNGVTVTDGIATVDLTSRYDDGGGHHLDVHAPRAGRLHRDAVPVGAGGPVRARRRTRRHLLQRGDRTGRTADPRGLHRAAAEPVRRRPGVRRR